MNGPENEPQPLYVTLILDETGSMQECKGAAIAGFNQYVATLRQEPAETQVPAESRKLCVILTDGEENASRRYTRSQIFDMIKAYENESWTFLYLGANHDVWAAGEELGVAEHNRITFFKSDVGQTFECLSQATATFRRKQRPSIDPPTSPEPHRRAT